MDITETTRLCKAIATIAPAQRFEDETPAFWSVILADVTYADARAAVLALGGKQPFISPHDIITEVRRVRAERLEHVDQLTPAADPDDVHGYIAALRATRAAVADGRTPAPAPDRKAIEGPAAGRLEAAARGVFRRPPRVNAAIEGRERPAKVKPPATITRHAAEQQEAERARQLAELAELAEGEVA